MRAFLKPGGLGVLTAGKVAGVIVKAASVKRPRSRYRVGLVANLGPIGRALTADRLVDFITMQEVSNKKD